VKENNRSIGNMAEEVACNYLKGLNYKIITRNFRCKLGEIDIIARQGDYIVFVEVKYRKDNSYGYPREAVNYYKQRNISKVALYYLLINNINNYNCRFDVVEIRASSIELIQNAFDLVY